jgi:hypothetical protein
MQRRAIRLFLLGGWILCFSVASFAAPDDPNASCSEGKELRSGRDWINADLEEISRQRDPAVVPKDDVYEVVASKLVYALDSLNRLEIEPLTDENARLLAGHHYRCGSGKKPYLVRAVWVGEMPFHVSTSGDVLIIQDGTAGNSNTAFRKSALVVNLATAPEKVLIAAYVHDDL